MKRVFALILVLAIMFSLTACGQPDAPLFVKRWGSQTETLTYTVALINPASDEAIYNHTAEHDEVLPNTVRGEYVTTLTHDGDSAVYTTVLNTTYTYSRASLSNEAYDTLNKAGVATINESDEVVITNTVTTSCTINGNSVLPVSSETVVKGAYVGKLEQCLNDYKVSLNYTKEGKKYFCKGSLTDNADPSRSVEYSYQYKATSLPYDNTCLFLLLRCYEVGDLVAETTFPVISPLANPLGAVTMRLSGSKENSLTLSNGLSGTFGKYTITTDLYQMVMFIDTTAKLDGSAGFVTTRNVPVKIQQGYLTLTLCQEDMLALGTYELPNP